MKTIKSPSCLRLARGIAQCHVQILRESPLPYKDEAGLPTLDTPATVFDAFTHAVPTDPTFDWERETFVVFMLTTRRKLASWQLMSVGTNNTLLVQPSDVFKLAIVCNASAIVVAHNHPSGDPTPSESDIRITRDLLRAGQLLKIELLDHVIVGNPALRDPANKGWSSLRELGYLY